MHVHHNLLKYFSMNFSCFYLYHNKIQFEDFTVKLHLDFKHIPSQIKPQLSTILGHC